MRGSLYVINCRGEREPFSLTKVYRSAKRAGASKELAQKISQIIRKEVYPGIKTSEIFKRIKEILNQESPQVALKFSLKEGMRKLGPSGFPFEKFIGEIFTKLGYEVKLNIYPRGHCLKYETDFLAQKNNFLYIGECKFRNLPEEGLVHSETALSYWAKILDLKRGNLFEKGKFKGFKVKPILVTNAKFTKEAIKYSKCVGIELLGWRCPKSGGLENIIDKEGFYPITILPSLNKNLADAFIKRKTVLAKDILEIEPKKFSKQMKISGSALDSLIKEAKILFET
jgi:hypothetical protein